MDSGGGGDRGVEDAGQAVRDVLLLAGGVNLLTGALLARRLGLSPLAGAMVSGAAMVAATGAAREGRKVPAPVRAILAPGDALAQLLADHPWLVEGTE